MADRAQTAYYSSYSPSMITPEFIEECIRFAMSVKEAQSSVDKDHPTSPTTTASTFPSLGFGGEGVSSVTSHTHDAHAVSEIEAQSYYAGLPSEPKLLYRTGKKWSPPRGPEAQRRLKELCEVFNHPITKLWDNGLGWEVVGLLDTHSIRFTTIDVVRFRAVEVDEEPEEAKKPTVSPVTIWIGVLPKSTSAAAAHEAAQDILGLLKSLDITDVDVDLRESFHRRSDGPKLLEPVDDLEPLGDVISPLTPALGLGISTIARPDAQGTMAVYLEEGNGSKNLIGLTCHHVLFGSEEDDLDYTRHQNGPPKDVVLLGNSAFTGVIDSTKRKIGEYAISITYWKRKIERYTRTEKTSIAADAAKAEKARIEVQALVDKAEEAIQALGAFLTMVEKNWNKLDDRVLGPILRSPAIKPGVGNERFTEDWGLFLIDRAKLGSGFKANKMDLGRKLTPGQFIMKCYPRGDDNWQFDYPNDGLLPLEGIITDELMRHPDMWDTTREPCLLVLKSGNATQTTIGRTNGVFSIVREYYPNKPPATSMGWAIMNYSSKSDVFSAPGDSGSLIADIRGRMGGMLTGGSGSTKEFDMTYATPIWWLLERIKKEGFPQAHFSVTV